MLYRARALPGRLARVHPGGPVIPEHGYMIVQVTDRIARMATLGDIVLEEHVEEPEMPAQDTPESKRTRPRDAETGASAAKQEG